MLKMDFNAEKADMRDVHRRLAQKIRERRSPTKGSVSPDIERGENASLTDLKESSCASRDGDGPNGV
jgi:hypothetical protein